jgi:hypothetical protein
MNPKEVYSDLRLLKGTPTTLTRTTQASCLLLAIEETGKLSCVVEKGDEQDDPAGNP